MSIEVGELDRMQSNYKTAVDEWIAAIRKEEALALVDHTIAQVDEWENAGFSEEAAREKPKPRRRNTRTRSGRNSSISNASAPNISRAFPKASICKISGNTRSSFAPADFLSQAGDVPGTGAG